MLRHLPLSILLLSFALTPAFAADEQPAEPATESTPATFTTDRAKEQHWAVQIRESLVMGKAVDLAVGSEKVLAIYTPETRGRQLGGVILLHGTGSHPDQHAVIQPLRTKLPEQGWSTLSVQMPIRPNGVSMNEYAPLFDEAAKRIDVAVQFMQSQGIRNISLIGHSLGAVMAADYLAKGKNPAIRGFVAVGIVENRRLDPRFDTPAAIEQIEIPMLDIYGSHDLLSVLKSAEARRQAAHRGANLIKKSRRTGSFEQSPIVTARDGSRGSGMVTYRQMEIAGANHYFSGQEAQLIKRIRGWLERHTTNQNRYISVE